MNTLYAAGALGGAFLIGAIAFQGGKNSAEQRNLAIATFSIAQHEEVVLDRCLDALNTNDATFTNLGNVRGCGCVTRQLSDALPQKELSVASLVFSKTVVANLSNYKKTKPIDEALNIFETSGVTANRYVPLWTAIEDSTSYCNASYNAYTDEEREDLEKKFEEERVTAIAKIEDHRAMLKKFVAEGKMTQERADRALASFERQHMPRDRGQNR